MTTAEIIAQEDCLPNKSPCILPKECCSKKCLYYIPDTGVCSDKCKALGSTCYDDGDCCGKLNCLYFRSHPEEVLGRCTDMDHNTHNSRSAQLMQPFQVLVFCSAMSIVLISN